MQVFKEKSRKLVKKWLGKKKKKEEKEKKESKESFD